MSDPAAPVAIRPAPRRGWVAVLLGILTPGLGQFYTGRPFRGLLWLVGVWLTVFVAELTLLNLDSAPLNVILPFIMIFGVSVAALVDAVRTARGSNSRPFYDRWYVYLAVILAFSFVAAPAAVAGIRKHVARTYQVPTSSMENTILFGDHIVVSTGAYKHSLPQRWDVVAFLQGGDPKDTHLCRAVGLPGDTVEIRSKILMINGAPIPDPHAIHIDPEIAAPRTSINYSEMMDRRDNFPPFVVPSGSYFLLGDSRDNSLDSRFRGPVRAEHVIGKVRRIYWSWDPQTKKIRWSRIGLSVS